MSTYDFKQVLNFVRHLRETETRKIEDWHVAKKSLVIIYQTNSYFEDKKCIPLSKIIKERSA